MRAPLLALLTGISLLATSARAQPAPAGAAPSPSAAPSSAAAAPAPQGPSQADRDRANALMDDADAKVASGDLAGALPGYEAAHAIMHVPSTGIEVAVTLEKLGRLLPALAAAREVAAMPAAPSEPAPFTAARDRAKALAAELEARVPTLAIHVKIANAGVRPEVRLDGRVLTRDELAAPLVLPPGKYRVAASADGHAPASVEVVLKERDRGQVTLALAPVLEPPPARKPPPPPPPATLSPLVPAGFAVVGVGALAGAITGVLAISAANEVDGICLQGRCKDEATLAKARSRYDTADALAIASDVSFVLALAGAAVGIYGITVSLGPSAPPDQPAPGRPARAAPAPSAALLVGPGTAGLRLSF